MKLYCLKNPMTGSHGAVLNGKIFGLKKGPDGSVIFHSPEPDGMKPIWHTTKVNTVSDNESGLELETQNTKYSLVKLEALVKGMQATNGLISLEAMLKDITAEQTKPAESAPTLDFKAVSTKRHVKPINYGDGYKSLVVEFNRKIDIDEFRQYLTEVEHISLLGKDKASAAWYEDYEIFYPFFGGTAWEYKVVNRYTD